MFDENDPIFEEENQKQLIEQIQNSPDCRIFGISKYKQRKIRILMRSDILLLLIVFVLGILYFTPDFTEYLLVAIGVICFVCYLPLYYLNFSHRYFKTYVSSLGIAKKSEWDEGAIPWEKIDCIEVKDKKSEIDYVIFRSGSTKVGYRNSLFVTRLSWAIISEYIGGLADWLIIDDFGELAETTKSNRFYLKPPVEKQEAQNRVENLLLLEWIGDQDFDASQTQEHPHSKTNKELYEMILNDPQRVCIKDASRVIRILSRVGFCFVLWIIIIGLMFVSMISGPYTLLIWIIILSLAMISFVGLFKSDERLFLSPIGIVRYYFGSPEALEWKYVEFVDFRTEEGVPIPFEFFGNQTRVYCPEHCYHDLLTLNHVLEYLPELNEWKKVQRYRWEDGIYRLIRPDV